MTEELKGQDQKRGIQVHDKDRGGIWIYAQTQGEGLHPVVIELLGEGRKLADRLARPLCAVLVGEHEALAQELFEYGADEVCLFRHSLLQQYSTDGYTKAVATMVQENRPYALLFGGTDEGRDLAPRVAARTRTGLTVDCTEFRIDEENQMYQIRPAFGSRLMAEIVTVGGSAAMCTVRPGMFEPAVRKAGRKGRLSRACLELSPEEIRTKTVSSVREEEGPKALETSGTVVAGGMGIGDREGFELLDELAGLFGGITGGTRPAAASGLIPHERMIGQTGRVIAPELYIACGISGAVQHLLGVGKAKCIVAVNNNPDAPIFEAADYGIVADYREFIPKLLKELKKTDGNSNI